MILFNSIKYLFITEFFTKISIYCKFRFYGIIFSSLSFIQRNIRLKQVQGQCRLLQCLKHILNQFYLLLQLWERQHNLLRIDIQLLFLESQHNQEHSKGQPFYRKRSKRLDIRVQSHQNLYRNLYQVHFQFYMLCHQRRNHPTSKQSQLDISQRYLRWSTHHLCHCQPNKYLYHHHFELQDHHM